MRLVHPPYTPHHIRLWCLARLASLHFLRATSRYSPGRVQQRSPPRHLPWVPDWVTLVPSSIRSWQLPPPPPPPHTCSPRQSSSEAQRPSPNAQGSPELQQSACPRHRFSGAEVNKCTDYVVVCCCCAAELTFHKYSRNAILCACSSTLADFFWLIYRWIGKKFQTFHKYIIKAIFTGDCTV